MIQKRSDNPIFGRVIPAMVTPFDRDLNVNYDTAQLLANNLVEMGSDALVVCATTGESPTVTIQEKLAMFSAVVEAVSGKAYTIANVGSYSTEDTISLAKSASKTGIDGIMCVVPYYNKPPQEGLYKHFSSIAACVDLPMVLYNIPGRCSVNLSANTTLKLAHDIENIVAIKEASGDLNQIREIINKSPDDFYVYSGDDELTFEIMKIGGDGVITTTGNVAPDKMRLIVDACVDGDFDSALQAHNNILPLMKGLFETTNPILVKAAIAMKGIDCGGLRLPLIDASQTQIEHLRETMKEVGIL